MHRLKIYSKLYLKIFIPAFFFSLPISIPTGCYFLMMGALFWASSGDTDPILWTFTHLNQGIVIASLLGCLSSTSLVFGGMMSLGLGSLHIVSVKQISIEENENILDVHQTRKIQLSHPYRKAFELCTLSLKAIGGCEIQRTDRNQGTIEAKTGITWKTFGDIIWFKIRKLDDNTTEIEVSSKPARPITVVDYGKNLENVEQIIAYLRAEGDT